MAKPEKTERLIAENRKARFDYFIEERYEAGLVLQGWEVKAMRAGCQSAPPIVSATWSRPNGGVSCFSMLSASACATVRSRYERDTASVGASIAAASMLISI